MIVLVAGVPARPFWTGVILTSQVPAFFRRIVHFAVRFLVLLLVVILQMPRAVGLARVSELRAFLVAVIV